MNGISIVVPIYNAEKYISKCIKSILNQTNRNFEIILVNDGSTDGTLKICNKYKEKDNRIVVINKSNEGVIKARRIGIEKAKFDYITFVDADDWIDKNTIKILSDEINKNNSDVIIFNMYRVIGKFPLVRKLGSRVYFEKQSLFTGEQIKNELAAAYLRGDPLPAGLWGKAYKKDILINSGKYLNRIKFLGEDLFYNLEIFLKAEKISMIDKGLYYYRYGGNTSKFMPYIFDDMISGYEIQREVINKYYQDTTQKRLNGISIMLLNTFKTGLYNIKLSNLTEEQIEKVITKYINNENLIEATYNLGATRYFDNEYLEAIRNKNIKYLTSIGDEIVKKTKIRRKLLNLLS